MKIYSVAFGKHDHNTYDGVWHNQIERHSRLKHNIPKHKNSTKLNRKDNTAGLQFYEKYWNPQSHEIFAFTTTVGGVNHITPMQKLENFMDWKPNHLWDYKLENNLYYIDHHQSHAAYAYLMSGFKESDILAIDGRGYKYNTVFFDKNGKVHNLNLYVGTIWDWFSKKIGFGVYGESKVMGLAAYGKYNVEVHMLLDKFWHTNELEPYEEYENIVNTVKHEDIAYTLQYATEEIIFDTIPKYKTSDNLCISGGVAYNGYVNEKFTKVYDNVFVPPAPGDEGQALGTYLHADYTLNKNIHVPNVYAGKEYNYTGKEKVNIKEVAQAIADGKIIGWFQGKSESGNRALGNRSILADPRNPNIKDIINRTIKKREDFRPFAPSVMIEHYKDFFDTNQSSPYMSRIVKVKSDKIPGVTHVDNTSRIQTVNSKDNPKFYELINEFYKITGIPMVLNTSFNCQEPIVETPEDAINTFNNTDLDILVINDFIERKGLTTH